MSLSACAVDSAIGIDGEDSTYFPTVRAFFDLTEEGAAPQEVDESSVQQPRFTNGLELGVTGASGDFDPDGAELDQTDYTLIEATAAWRGGVVLRERLRLELIGGVGYLHSNLDATGPVRSVSEKEDRLGLLLGAQVGWQPVSRVELFGRATVLPLYSETVSTQLEAGVELTVIDELDLLLAYRWWNYESEDFDSDLKADIDFSGPVFGLVLEF